MKSRLIPAFVAMAGLYLLGAGPAEAGNTHAHANTCAAPTTPDASRSSAAGPISTPSVAYGMNYDWWKVNLSLLDICETGKTGATVRGTAILANYDKPGIRDTVRGQLKEMHDSGFFGLRTMMRISNQPIPGAYFGVGESAAAGTILREYAADAAAAGFHHLEIVYVAQASERTCGGGGGCYDDQTVQGTIAFIVGARRALGDTSGIELSFDLANEACGFRGRPSLGNLNDFLVRLTSAYVAAFPHDRTTISCGARHFMEGRQSIDAAYRAAGRAGPDFYEVHLYYAPGPQFGSVMDAVEQVNSALGGSRTPVVIGETGYGDAGTLQEITDGLRNAGGGLQAVYIWPKKQPYPMECAADVDPPYTLRDALGKQ